MRIALPMILLVGAVLRFYDLGNPLPGVYRDEFIEGLHGVYHARGMVGTGNAWITFSRVPVWELILTGSVGWLGPTIPALRLPAALLGVAGIWLCFAGLRGVAGRGPALFASGMLAGSFWNVLVSRLGQPFALVVFQTGLITWLALAKPGLPAPRSAAALGLVAGSGFYTYFGAVTLPLIAGWLVWIHTRNAAPPVPVRMIARAMTPAVGVVALVGSLACFRIDLLSGLERHLHPSPTDAAERLGRFMRVLAFPTPAESPDSGFWGIYPRGWPLLSPLESTAALLGLLAWFGRGPGRWLAPAALGTIVLGFLPAATAGGLVFHRAAGVIVPVAMLQAAGYLMLRRRWPKLAPAIAAVAVALNAGWATRLYFATWRHDPLVHYWADGVETKVALDLKRRAARGPIHLINPLGYGDNPALAYLLDAEISSGRVGQIAAPTHPDWVVDTIYREPVHRQPLIVLMREAGAGTRIPTFLVAAPPALLAAGDTALDAGRISEAIAHFRAVLRRFPDYGLAHAKLARAYAIAGRPTAAARSRTAAERLGVSTP